MNWKMISLVIQMLPKGQLDKLLDKVENATQTNKYKWDDLPASIALGLVRILLGVPDNDKPALVEKIKAAQTAKEKK